MTKLVDQIVTEQLHHIAGKCEKSAGLRAATTNDILARCLLSEIADEAHPAFLVKALAALGVTTSLDDLGQRFQGVCDVRAAAFKAAGIDIEAEHAAQRTPEPLARFLDAVEVAIKNGIERKAAAAPASTTTPEPSAEPSQAVDAIAAEFGSDAPPAAEPVHAPLATAVDAAA